MSNDKLWEAVKQVNKGGVQREEKVARLLKTPEGRAGLEWTVRAAAALPVRAALVPAPPTRALPSPARRVAPLRRTHAPLAAAWRGM